MKLDGADRRVDFVDQFGDGLADVAAAPIGSPENNRQQWMRPGARSTTVPRGSSDGACQLAGSRDVWRSWSLCIQAPLASVSPPGTCATHRQGDRPLCPSELSMKGFRLRSLQKRWAKCALAWRRTRTRAVRVAVPAARAPVRT